MNQQYTSAFRRIGHRRAYTVPTLNQVRRLLSSLGTDPDESQSLIVVSLIVTTGIRPCELWRVRWSDVDFDQRSIFVESFDGGRFVPFGPRALALLVPIHDRAADTEYILGRYPRRVVEHATNYLKDLSITECNMSLNAHELRRFFCSQWIALGGDAASLIAVIGRSCPYTRMALFNPERVLEIAASFQSKLENELLKSLSFDHNEVSA
jgi:integrase